MLTLSEVKEHLRIDHDADNSLLAAYIKAADNYMASAIDDYHAKLAASQGTDGDTWAAAANLAQAIMIAGWYENRLPAEVPKVTAVNVIIQQLQMVNPGGYVG